MRLPIIISFIIFSFISCDKCRDQECFTPPPVYIFEFLDAETDENLFTNGTFSSDDISITDDAGEPINFMFITENDKNQLVMNHIGWKTEEIDYIINIADQVEFTFYVNAEREMGECCSFTTIHEEKIEGVTYETDPVTEVIEIYPEI